MLKCIGLLPITNIIQTDFLSVFLPIMIKSMKKYTTHDESREKIIRASSFEAKRTNTHKDLVHDELERALEPSPEINAILDEVLKASNREEDCWFRNVFVEKDYDLFKTPNSFGNRLSTYFQLIAKVITTPKEDMGGMTFFERMGMIRKMQLNKDTKSIRYKELLYGKTRAEEVIRRSSERIKGKNNPAYGHGGKFSPFSKKFVKYQSEDDYKTGLTEVRTRSKQTKAANPQKENTKLEYYLAQGLSYEEAVRARAERQTTFTLMSCVEKHGYEKGKQIHDARQVKWKQSFNKSIPKEKLLERQRKGAFNKNSKTKKDPDGRFYLIALTAPSGAQFLKVGYTTNQMHRRAEDFNKPGWKVEVLDYLLTPRSHERAFEAENLALSELHKHSLLAKNDIDPEVAFLNMSETFRMDSDEVFELVADAFYVAANAVKEEGDKFLLQIPLD